MTPTQFVRCGFMYGFLSIAAFLSIFPFLWMAISATNSTADIIRGKFTFGDQLVTNIKTVLETVDVVQVTWNTVYITVVSTVLTLLVSSLAGYGFEIFRSKSKERVFGVMLVMLSIPFAALMIPLFVMMVRAGLMNTHTAVILPTISSIFIIFYFRQATKAFPMELRDAAKIDGLKEWQIFVSIYMPVMRPTYAAATIIVFMMNWNNFLWPLIVLQTSEMKTLTLTISSLSQAYYPDFGAVMVATILATLPTLAVFFGLQRLFVQGLSGSVK